jgi:hypothetical protein
VVDALVDQLGPGSKIANYGLWTRATTLPAATATRPARPRASRVRARLAPAFDPASVSSSGAGSSPSSLGLAVGVAELPSEGIGTA